MMFVQIADNVLHIDVLFDYECAARKFNVASLDRARVLKAANQYLSEKPITITASSSPAFCRRTS
jgi:hypothetical protein